MNDRNENKFVRQKPQAAKPVQQKPLCVKPTLLSINTNFSNLQTMYFNSM